MAIEEAIARNVGGGESPNTLRFWRSRPSIVIGCYQSVDSEIKLKTWTKTRVPIVRRFTGGGAVYHDNGNLNYSISIKPQNGLKTDITSTIERFSRGPLEVLKRYGIRPYLESRRILIGGKKISGSAGSLRWGCLVHHGTLLVNSDIKTLNRMLNVDETSHKSYRKYVRSAFMPVTSLHLELEQPVSMEEVKRVLRECFEDTLSIQLDLGHPTPEEINLASDLHLNKYGKPEWNLKY